MLTCLTNHLQVMREEPVASNRTPVRRSRERANDRRAHEHRQVESVLRIPLRRYKHRQKRKGTLDGGVLTPTEARHPRVSVPQASETNPLSDKCRHWLQGKRRPGEKK